MSIPFVAGKSPSPRKKHAMQILKSEENDDYGSIIVLGGNNTQLCSMDV